MNSAEYLPLVPAVRITLFSCRLNKDVHFVTLNKLECADDQSVLFSTPMSIMSRHRGFFCLRDEPILTPVVPGEMPPKAIELEAKGVPQPPLGITPRRGVLARPRPSCHPRGRDRG